MYKLIALDMDGTLLKSDDSISRETKEALTKCMDQGVMVVLCTGRPFQGVIAYVKELGLSGLMITYNGAMIVKVEGRKIVFHKSLKAKDAKQVIDLGLERDTTIIIWSNNKLYVNRYDENAKTYEAIAKTEAIVVEDYKQIISEGVTKVLWFDNVENTNRYLVELEGKVNKSINYCTSRPNFLEFFDGNVSKADAMKFIGKTYGIKQEEMIAMGDGFNDLSMIEYAGLGVAMGNAEEEVRLTADYITSSNDENGIVKVVDKFIIQNIVD